MRISRNSAPHYTWGGDCDGWRFVDRKELSVIYERMPPGRSEVRHFHSKASQLFFVLSGNLTIEVDGETFRVNVGEAVEVVATRPHQVLNDSDEAAEFLVISQPTTRDDRTAT